MHAFSYFMPQARAIMRPIWSSDGTRVAYSAMKWLFDDAGSCAFTRYVDRMLMGKALAEARSPLGEVLMSLARQVFALEVEIAARRAGWCPELEGPSVDTDDP